MICASFGGLWQQPCDSLQVAMAAWGKAGAAGPGLHPELCLTPAGSPRLLQPLVLLLQAPRMLGHAQDSTVGCSFLWALLLSHCLSPDLSWGMSHQELLTHLLATGRTCCRATITKLQIKPQGRWKDVRKGHLILFLLKMKVSSQFFTRYGSLVTLQGKHK